MIIYFVNSFQVILLKHLFQMIHLQHFMEEMNMIECGVIGFNSNT